MSAHIAHNSRKVDFWTQKTNQRHFFDQLGSKLKISHPSDWGKVKTLTVFKQIGGYTVLRCYKSSLFQALNQIYPGFVSLLIHLIDIKWKQEWFTRRPRGQLKNKRIQRQIFDEIAKKYNIRNPQDWGLHSSSLRTEVSVNSISNHYSFSLRKALATIYPGIYFLSM